MHQTLKQAVARPPRASWPAQQRALEAFRHEYNYERPHEALHLTPPADHYVPAPLTPIPAARRSLPRSLCRAPGAQQRRD